MLFIPDLCEKSRNGHDASTWLRHNLYWELEISVEKLLLADEKIGIKNIYLSGGLLILMQMYILTYVICLLFHVRRL